ncbi:glycine cleavage system H protein [Desulfohalotomaculum tongense]|uniref:glycine cleavage system protein GcvH n=1 Tax=Desulforadius tongensis TaxID=1216062 RepID=UPI00195E486E|nr:glycine cleavage system protein GcvH [Desulforadius tongensis]MBM7855251.1 glycine cleavage system H protein [Desulforadius tongensis]
MANIPAELKYSREHEWIKLDGDRATIGITDYAQDSLGDIVFVELPSVGDTFEAEDTLGVVESVKAASDIYTPLSGRVVEINEELLDAPETINEDPYGKGWMVVMELSDPSQVENLLSKAEYEAYLEENA